ncbi:MAG: hypothetical protein IPP66_04570 [Anaerolineales bacterium]|nr:hypothetical protein [Anaerolineales bacterium]
MSSINISLTKSKFTNWVTSTLREAAWAPLSVVGFYLLGLALHLFDQIPQMDIPTHFFGGVTITYFYRAAIRNSQDFLGDIPLPVQILLAFTATGTTTVFWEFYENIMDYFFGFHMVLGLTDTIKDMAMGLLGALVLLLFYRKK